MQARRMRIPLTALLTILFTCAAVAGDWPMYQHDAARSAVTDEGLKTPLVPLWTFAPLVPPDPAWTQPAKEAARVRFDDSLHVAVVGKSAYFGSSGDNQVYALSTDTGEIRWRYYTDGPVRLAPTIADGRAYFGSDDGFAYCANAADGSLIWKRRAADHTDRVIGHGRIISLWPVRSGVLVDGGVAYFAAGVFPSESIYIHAVDAADGTPIWRNDVTGEFGPEQQYDGISPQGYLLASADTLYVASGRSMPAAFDRATGKFKFYLRPGGKVGGAYALLTGDHLVAGVNEQRAYNASTGETEEGGYAWSPAHRLIVAGGISYSLGDHELSALDRNKYAEYNQKRVPIQAAAQEVQNEVRDIYRLRYRLDEKDAEYQQKYDELSAQLEAKLAEVQKLDAERKEIEGGSYKWRRENDCRDSMILAGGVLFTGGEGRVNAIDAETGRWLWTGDVEGRADGLAVADGKLFVSTNMGRIYCFAQRKPAHVASHVDPYPDDSAYPEDELSIVYKRAAENIVAETGINHGFCLVLGAGEGRLALELAKRTELTIYGIEDDPAKVARARTAINAAGYYGKRVTIDEGSLLNLPYPGYFANLIVSDDVLVTGRVEASAEEMYRVLRPAGGLVYLGQPREAQGIVPAMDADQLGAWLSTTDAPEPTVTRDEGLWAGFTRPALAGAGSWTHQYGNPANTANSGDALVKAPLGVLWFGRPGPERMVERHGRAAAPVSIDGQLFVQGENVVMAYDAYNGTELWQRDISGAVRVRVDVDGSNMAVTEEGLFVATRDKALRLDRDTGATEFVYDIPSADDDAPRRWGTLFCVGKTLYGTSTKPLKEEYGASWQNPSEDPIDNLNAYRPFNANGGMWRNMQRWPDWGREDTWKGALTRRRIDSDAVFALDVESGQPRWVYRGDVGQTTISIGEGVVFLTDANVTDEQRDEAIAARRERYGLLTDEDADKDDPALFDVRRLVALDATTGVPRWQRVVDLTGSGGDRLGTVYFDNMLLIFGNFSNHDGSQFSKGGLAWRRVTVVSADDGSDLWSKELNYLRRPFLIGNQLVVEPRSVDAHTGEFRMRYHPVTGQQVPWEFKRGGHSCGVCTASNDTFFFRSDSINYYDVNTDQGMLPVGATRAGCWINMIPCNGLALLPEASAGCTCSFPIRSTICMAPKQMDRAWGVYASPGPLTPVRHMFINLGAPGDRKDPDGNLWFGYPRLRLGYGVRFDLKHQIDPSLGFYARAFDAVPIAGTDKPFVFSSGVAGAAKFVIPVLDEGAETARYTVRLGFCEPVHEAPGKRLFDIRLQGNVVAQDFDVFKESGGRNVAYVAEFPGIEVTGDLLVEITSSVENPTEDQAPILSSIEILE